jgi:hypothetical protein
MWIIKGRLGLHYCIVIFQCFSKIQELSKKIFFGFLVCSYAAVVFQTYDNDRGYLHRGLCDSFVDTDKKVKFQTNKY